MSLFEGVYKNKRVLVTGNTGFKGSWLSAWLVELGAEVFGLSKDIPTEPSHFEVAYMANRVNHIEANICDCENILKLIKEVKPDFLFHLAAQAIVSLSYINPIETITSNVVGTTNILEALRESNHKCTAIIITSDKAYDNVEQVW